MVGGAQIVYKCLHQIQGRSMYFSKLWPLCSPYSLVPISLGGPLVLQGFLPSSVGEGRQRSDVALRDGVQVH
jgi:hypothetical protein